MAATPQGRVVATTLSASDTAGKREIKAWYLSSAGKRLAAPVTLYRTAKPALFTGSVVPLTATTFAASFHGGSDTDAQLQDAYVRRIKVA